MPGSFYVHAAGPVLPLEVLHEKMRMSIIMQIKKEQRGI